MKERFVFTLCFGLLVFVGCDSPNVVPSPETAFDEAFAPTVTIPRPYAEPAASLSAEDFAAQFEALGELGPLAEPKALPSAEDLSAYAALLAEQEGEVYHSALEQTVAFFILDTVFRPDSDTKSYLALEREAFSPEEQAAAGFATRLLVKNHSPNADLIAASLEAVEGYWSEAEIREAARATREATDLWLAARCGDCEAKLAAALPQAGRDRTTIAVSARNELAALAQ
jgi:hypothetical protein